MRGMRSLTLCINTNFWLSIDNHTFIGYICRRNIAAGVHQMRTIAQIVATIRQRSEVKISQAKIDKELLRFDVREDLDDAPSIALLDEIRALERQQQFQDWRFEIMPGSSSGPLTANKPEIRHSVTVCFQKVAIT